MRVPDEFVRLLHRLFGFKAGVMVIRKEGGRVVEVTLDGRVLDPSEWQSVRMLHVEHHAEKKAAP